MELLHTTLVDDGKIGLPSQILDQLGVAVGGEVEVRKENGKIVISTRISLTARSMSTPSSSLIRTRQVSRF